MILSPETNGAALCKLPNVSYDFLPYIAVGRPDS